MKSGFQGKHTNAEAVTYAIFDSIVSGRATLCSCAFSNALDKFSRDANTAGISRICASNSGLDVFDAGVLKTISNCLRPDQTDVDR